MKTRNNAYQKRDKASDSGLNSIKRFCLWMLAVVGSIVCLTLWAVIRPLWRGIGWVLSLISALAFILWLSTL